MLSAKLRRFYFVLNVINCSHRFVVKSLHFNYFIEFVLRIYVHVGKSGNGLSPIKLQTIYLTKAGLVLIGRLRKNSVEIEWNTTICIEEK